MFIYYLLDIAVFTWFVVVNGSCVGYSMYDKNDVVLLESRYSGLPFISPSES